MNNIKYKIIGILLILIFTLSIFSMNIEEKNILTSSKNITNGKIGWGIKRNNNHEQPDVGANNKKVLEENNGICLGNSEKNAIYLTFDEGYEARLYETNTRSIKGKSS